MNKKAFIVLLAGLLAFSCEIKMNIPNQLGSPESIETKTSLDSSSELNDILNENFDQLFAENRFIESVNREAKNFHDNILTVKLKLENEGSKTFDIGVKLSTENWIGSHDDLNASEKSKATATVNKGKTLINVVATYFSTGQLSGPRPRYLKLDIDIIDKETNQTKTILAFVSYIEGVWGKVYQVDLSDIDDLYSNWKIKSRESKVDILSVLWLDFLHSNRLK